MTSWSQHAEIRGGLCQVEGTAGTKASGRRELCSRNRKAWVSQRRGGKLGRWCHDVSSALRRPWVLCAGREAAGRCTSRSGEQQRWEWMRRVTAEMERSGWRHVLGVEWMESAHGLDMGEVKTSIKGDFWIYGLSNMVNGYGRLLS